MSHERPLAMHSILLVLAGILAPAQSGGFADVYVASESERIAFVHVQAQFPTPRLAVFSESQQLASWAAGQGGQAAQDSLEASERYVLSPKSNALGVVFYGYPCLEGTGISRVAQWTELRLPYGLPNGFPPREPPLPPPPLPIRVDRAAWVRISESGNLVAFMDAGHHIDDAGRVQLFRRSGSAGAEFTASGEYTFDSGGEIQMSADGRVIAHSATQVLRLIDGAGEERARLPLVGTFALSADGKWLARWADGQLRIGELPQPLSAPISERALEVSRAPTHIAFAGDHTLVVERDRVSVFALPSGLLVWSREAPRGRFSSGDLMAPDPGRLLIAVGELDVLTPPMRGVRGRCNVRARVFELATDELLTSTEFELSDWTADQPFLQLLGAPSQLLVTTTERVQLSPPIP